MALGGAEAGDRVVTEESRSKYISFSFFLHPSPAPAPKSVHLGEGFGTVGENNIYTRLRFLPIFHTTRCLILPDSNVLVKLRIQSGRFILRKHDLSRSLNIYLTCFGIFTDHRKTTFFFNLIHPKTTESARPQYIRNLEEQMLLHMLLFKTKKHKRK